MKCIPSVATVACLSICLFSCEKRQEQTPLKSIPVETAMANLTELKASDCFRQVTYIPLETTDSCLVGRSPKVRLFTDKILITTHDQCLLFDRKGRFITSIGHVGGDPEGYNSVTNWVEEQTETIYFPGWNNNLMAYRADGTFKGTVRVPEGDKIPIGSFEFLDNGLFFQYVSNLFSSQEYLLFFRDNEVVKKMPVNVTDTTQFDMTNIRSVSVVKSELAGKYTPAGMDGVVFIQLKNQDEGLVMLPGTTHSWRTGDDVFYKTSYNDTIFQVLDTSIVPVQVFDLGKHHWEYADRFNKERKEAILMSQILDSKDYMLFRFMTDVFGKVLSYNALLNKQTGEVKIADCNEGIQDDLNDFISLQPLTVSSAGEYAGLLPADQVVSWFEDHKSATSTEKVKLLKEVGEEDNPIIVIMK